MKELIRKLIMFLVSVLTVIFLIGVIMWIIHMVIMTGSSYLKIYREMGNKDLIICFLVSICYYGSLFYGLYRLDLKVRKKINKSNIK